MREAGKRALRMRHFDVQLLGGMVLHYGKIAEMRTGEGKTLVATLPAYLNALGGRAVHIVTVNDYLAQRDAAWMGKLYGFLGLTVGVNIPQLEPDEKRKAYAADIVYGTNNEFGFDYLRDNMAMHVEEKYQRGLHYAIVDEVDSILIDEARTPLIISGQAEDRTEIYVRMNEVAPLLTRQKEENGPGDFWVDEKGHQILLSEAGHARAEEVLARVGLLPQGASLYEPAYINLVHQLYAALRAHHLFLRDQQYVVQNGEVIIVDEFTGRLMQGRRWSDGSAPGGRGQGEGLDPEREPDAGLDHLPELLPPIRQARGHDRHGGHRGVRVPGHLRAGDGRRADAQAHDPGRSPGPGVPHGDGEVQGDHRRHPRLLRRAGSRCWSAPLRSRTPSCCPRC